MNSRGWRGAVVAVALLSGLCGLTVANARDADVGVLEPLQGLVQHRAAGQLVDTWQTVTEVEMVGAGDWLRTDTHGWAILTFFEGAQVEILANSLVTVDQLRTADAPQGTVTISLAVLAGDTLYRFARLADPRSQVVIHTPSAGITIRGTEFWVRVFPMGETQALVNEGTVVMQGMRQDGTSSGTLTVEAGTMGTVFANGDLGQVEPIREAPLYPPQGAPLAPSTCGSERCDPGESAENCALDCDRVSAVPCGDGVCNRSAGEGPLACPQDCVPPWGVPGIVPPPESLVPNVPTETAALHFFWGEMRCDLTPDPAAVRGPLAMYWGIGCFDTEAAASAHPHPADYQLVVDGQTWDMSTLRQSGPYIHRPYCPWGWNFDLGPITLPPGTHTLTLIETAIDTWSGESGGRTAGDTNRLTCHVTVKR